MGGLLCLLAIASVGCRQGGGQPGSAGLAPISQLPGQPGMTGPTMPALGPFGASARVPPPPTGSYGNPSGVGMGGNAMPANYAPSNLAPMSYQQSGQSHNVAVAGGPVPASPVPANPVPANFGTPAPTASIPSPWQETSASYPGIINPQMDLSSSPTSGPRGGMPVIDLTMAPPPPGYSAGVGFSNMPAGFNTQTYLPQPGYQPQQPAYVPPPGLPGQFPATTLMPMPMPNDNQRPGLQTAPSYDGGGWTAPAAMPSSPPANMPGTAQRSTSQSMSSQPISGGGMANSAPAANQPAFSTAERPIQWQTSTR